MSHIEQVEVIEFTYTVENVGYGGIGLRPAYNLGFQAGTCTRLTKFAVIIRASDGSEGQYVTHWVGSPVTMSQTLALAPLLLGRDPDAREAIWSDLRRELRQHDGMGIGPLDIALWDLGRNATVPP